MDDTSALVGRLSTLERGQRRLVIAWIALALGLAVSILWHLLWVPEIVSARRFVLKDAAGGVRGDWGPIDVTAGEVDGKTQLASTTCLAVKGPKAVGLHLCAPWDAPGGPSISMWEETGASLHIGLDAYTVSILGRTSRSRSGARGALVLGVWQDKASIQVSDKEGRRTQLQPDGLFAYDSQGGLAYQTPGASASSR